MNVTNRAGNGASIVQASTELLTIRDLTIDFRTPTDWLRVIHGVDLDIRRGETIGLVGESGSGKSVTCLSVMRLLGKKSNLGGAIEFADTDLALAQDDHLDTVRGGRIAMIFQDPTASLNPVKSIGLQLTETLRRHRSLTAKAAKPEAINLLEKVGISEARQRLKEYPHQLSGGQNQRVMIAMALAGDPDLLIADEPTTALDVTIQAQILDLLRMIRQMSDMAILLVTHDLGVVAELCDRVAVMYAGRIVERGPVIDVFKQPVHPYTHGLLESLPRIDMRVDRLIPIEGTVPAPSELPPGCAFAPRCAYATDRCTNELPLLELHTPEHTVACFQPQTGPLSFQIEETETQLKTDLPFLSSDVPLLKIENLVRHFPVRQAGGFLGFGHKALLRAVDGISFSIPQGEKFGLVGESGCGKSTTAKLVMSMLPPTSGTIEFAGQTIDKLNFAEWRALRRDMQMVFQDPLGALDPRMKVGEQIVEPMLIHKIGTPAERRERALDFLDSVGLKPHNYERYPHQLSGGQRQRVVLARALMLEPKLLVCDEPISACDVSIQAQVINLLEDLQAKLNLTYLFISHDLRVVRHFCHRIAVMYLGKIVEIARDEALFTEPAHPYTRALLSAIPIPNPAANRERVILPGDPPSPVNPPSGCRFHTRCPLVQPLCHEREPILKPIGDGHQVSCHVAHGEA